MDTEQGTESTQAETENKPLVEAPSEGTQPSEETTNPNPAPEAQGSEPTIPYSRFQEVNRRMREAEAKLNHQQQQSAQAQQPQAIDAGAPKESDFETFTDYVRAEARFTAKQEATKHFNDLQAQNAQTWKQQQEQAREAKAGSNFIQKWNAETAKDPSLKSLPTDPVMDMPRDLALLVMGSEAAGPLMAQLLRNPEEAYRLSALPPYEAAYAVGQMVNKLSGSTGQPSRKPSGNIPDLDPVRTGTGKGSKRADDMSQDDVLRTLFPH